MLEGEPRDLSDLATRKTILEPVKTRLVNTLANTPLAEFSGKLRIDPYLFFFTFTNIYF